MKLIFMGTPEFALPSLRSILASRHELLAAVTAPDAPRGRGQNLSPTPVKAEAAACGIPLLQPEKMRDPAFASALASYGADLFVVVAFRILPKEIFAIPLRGTFNLHASLLPKYRGAAPINWALINGEKETGVTTFFIREQVDTGNVLLRKKTGVGEEETAGELHDRLALLGAEAVMETLDMIDRGGFEPERQDDALATPAPKIFHDTCRVDWNLPARRVHDFVRGLSPHPGAWTLHASAPLKIYRTRILDEDAPGLPGTLLETRKRLVVACGRGSVEILELKPESRKRMTGEEFLRGYFLHPGERFG